MSDLKIDQATNRLVMESGDLVLTQGQDTIQQHLISRLRSFRQEWFLNLDEGVPYFQEVLKKNPNPKIIDAIFKDVIVNTDGVIELTEFDLKFDTEARKLLVAFTCETLEGEINFEGLI